jgi:uncharacterized protein (TIGR00730 family)
MWVGIFCSSRDTSTIYAPIVFHIIKILSDCAISGIVYGGGNNGLMGIVQTLAHDYSMPIIGHNLERWKQETACKNPEYIYPTLLERQKGLITSSDMYLVLPGGIGTIYELIQVLAHNDVEHLYKPIVLYNVDHLFDPLLDMFRELVSQGLMDVKRLCFYIAHSEEDIEIILRHLTHHKTPSDYIFSV